MPGTDSEIAFAVFDTFDTFDAEINDKGRALQNEFFRFLPSLM